jgi:hypothetical protein
MELCTVSECFSWAFSLYGLLSTTDYLIIDFSSCNQLHTENFFTELAGIVVELRTWIQEMLGSDLSTFTQMLDSATIFFQILFHS